MAASICRIVTELLVFVVIIGWIAMILTLIGFEGKEKDERKNED